MRAFTQGEAHEPNIDFHRQSHKPNERFYWLSSQTKQRFPAKDIIQEIEFYSSNYNNVSITITHKKYPKDIFHS